MQIPDHKLIKAILSGKDDHVLEVLYNELYPKIEYLILRNGGDQEEAQDIFQDAVVILYKQVKEDKFDQQYQIAGFVYTVSRNLWINRAKRKNRNTELPEDDQATPLEGNVMDDMLSEERAQYIEHVLSKLDPKCKDLLIYSIFHNLSMKEISKLMNFNSEDVAKTKNYKCKKKLLKIIENNPNLKNLLFYND